MTTSKQTAVFRGVRGWRDGGELGIFATLYGVQHPVLGWEDIVHTSRVLGIYYDEEDVIYEIETKNTIYLRKEDNNVA